MNLKRFLPFMKHALLVAAMLTVVGISGCDDDEEPKPTKTIWELVQENEDLTMVEEQLLAAGLDADLSADGSFTLFAPSDAAMSQLLLTLGLDDFSSVSPTVIQAVLEYHIAATQYLYNDLEGAIVTMQGENITIVENQTGDKELDTGATSNAGITTKNIKATNGVIHIINTVIVPPILGDLLVKTLGTVAQPLLLAGDFTTLSSAIQLAEVYALTNAKTPLLGTVANPGTLIGDDIITVFAPTNQTFTALSITAATFTGEQWYAIIRNHIVAGDYHEDADFTAMGAIPTLAGNNLVVLSKAAPTNPGAGIMTGIVLDSDGTYTVPGTANPDVEAQIAVLDVLTATGANPANNGYINVIAGFLRKP